MIFYTYITPCAELWASIVLVHIQNGQLFPGSLQKYLYSVLGLVSAMAKGHKKRKASGKFGFHPYHPCHSTHVSDVGDTPHSTTRYVRLDKDLHGIAVNSDGPDVDARDSQGQLCDVSFLRPRPAPPSKLQAASKTTNEDNERQTMRPLHLLQCERMWNEAFREHCDQSPHCGGDLGFDMAAEQQIGLCWKERLRCQDCSYISAMYKLYEEAPRTGKRGRRFAAPNLAFAAGLTHTGIGPTGARRLLISQGMPAPSATSMQKTAAKVADQLTDLNKADMKSEREFLKKINKVRGLPEDAPIRVESDARYNNPLYASVGKTPTHAATQQVLTVAENSTKEKKILSVAVRNKLCQIGALAQRRRGLHHLPCKTEAGHSGHCSATIAQDEQIGDEYQAMQQSVRDLQEDGINIAAVTTDGDSRAFKAVGDMQPQDQPAPIRLQDTRHLSEAQRRATNNTAFSDGMFPGKTKADREMAKGRFAHDVAKRCTAEFDAAFTRHKGDTSRMVRTLSFATDAILLCYAGNHSRCGRHSLVCAGTKSRMWKTAFMRHLPGDLKPNEKDIDHLRQCVAMRLSPKAVMVTRYRTTTQKSEWFNRLISLRQPKNMTFSRTGESRIHSTVHQANRGPGESLSIQMERMGVPVRPGTRRAKQLYVLQQRHQCFRSYPKRQTWKERRAWKRELAYARYDANLAEKCYKKGMSSNTRPTLAGPSQRDRRDHSYCHV